ncbi:putative cyclin-B3-1 isoform X1 [Cryptomeria japonica]|uniref:putative cyclin-B3-1 isoform X1 n=1 Tax=Cryptomeria japonica TaxID=3369 RepID=UPI0027DA433F|nr:putative cyclin-B3-1 isoform X1 [Cryptomeria japonica]
MDSSTQGKFGVENRVQKKATGAPGKVVTRANTRARRVLCDIGNVGGRPARQSNEADDVQAEKSKKKNLVGDRPVPRKFGINLTNNSSARVSSSSLQNKDGKGNVRQKVAAKSIKLSASVKTHKPLVVRLSGSHKSAIGKPPRVSNVDISGKPPRASTVGFSGKPPRVSNLDGSAKCTLNSEVHDRPSTSALTTKFSAKQASSSADSVPQKPPIPSNDYISGKGNSDEARVKKVLPPNARVISRKILPADASKRKVKPQTAFTSALTTKLKVHPAKAKVVSGRIKPPDASKRKGKMRKSFTSTLTARSEAFLGPSQPERIERELPNIDESDNENQLAVADYVNDIYNFYWDVEARKCPSSSYMSSQLDINPKMRAILVDWLIDVHLKFELMPETLFLMTNILDRFLSIHVITRKDFQLVGLTALLIASKYEEIWPPKVEDLLEISKNSYTHDQMLSMEKLMLNKLRFNLTVPTPYVFLKRFLKAAQADEELENLSFYLIELCLVEYESLQWKPSMLAASVTCIAQHVLKREPPWTRLLQKHAHYIESELKECATMVARFHLRAEKNDLQVVRKKYLGSDFKCVAKLPCVTYLP